MTSYIVFHTEEAGSPAVYLAEFGKHGWVFEPSNYDGGLFSSLYDTKEQAEEAAEEWVSEYEAEESICY